MTPDDPFESTASYYAEYRPRYGEAPMGNLVDRFGLDDGSRALDLGCGTGQTAIPLANHVGEVVGVDLGDELGPVTVTTMGRSFHWMAREPTLERLRELTEPGGGVAVFGDTEWLTSGRRDWQDEVYALASEYLDDLPERTGPRTEPYETPYDELIADCGFEGVDVATFDRTREWTVDEVVGYVFSLSFCSPATFGDARNDFESDLRERLEELGGGPLEQDEEVRVTSGRKRERDG